jgi:hypothetical protein
MWFLFLWPTITIAADFLYASAFNKNAVVDTAHFAALLLWVIGNSVWALGEFFFEEYDEPLKMWKSSDEAFKTARWYSSWILFSAYFPIIVMYMVWIPLTMTGLLSVQHRDFKDVPHQKLIETARVPSTDDEMTVEERSGSDVTGLGQDDDDELSSLISSKSSRRVTV